jgi:hypothetical protein
MQSENRPAEQSPPDRTDSTGGSGEPKAPIVAPPAPFYDALAGTPVLPSPYPDEVFHYTTVDGLRGIIESGKIWATEAGYLNDASEYVYANDIVVSVAAELGERLAALVNVAEFLRINPKENPFQFYVSCFCEDRDLLSQWRTYGHEGTGYAIGFRLDALRSLASDFLGLVGKVVYDRSEQTLLVRTVLRSALGPIVDTDIVHDTFLRLVGEVGDAARRAAPEEAARILEESKSAVTREMSGLVAGPLKEAMIKTLAVRAFLKYPRFYEEREWRLMLVGGSRDVESFRSSRGLLVPYVPVYLGERGSLPIKKIVIGPSLYPSGAERSLRRYLNANGLSAVEIEASPIPLRV